MASRNCDRSTVFYRDGNDSIEEVAEGGWWDKTRAGRLARKTGSLMARSLPSVSAHGGLTRYLEEIRQFPMLEPEQEYMLAKRWQEHDDPEAAHRAGHVAPAARRAHRHGLSRLRPADRRGHLGGQRRPDAGGQALRSRQGLPARHLRHVVDPRLDPGVHPALVEPGEDGHHGGAEEALLQPAQGQGSDPGAGGGRPHAPTRSSRSPPSSA